MSEEKQREIEEASQGSPFAKLLGLQAVKEEKGRVVLRLPFTKNLLQTLGRVHGGAIFALADHACGWAVHTLLEKGERCATLEMKINYIAAVHAEACVAEAHVIHKGRTSIVVEAEVKTEAGRLVAKTLATFVILREA